MELFPVTTVGVVLIVWELVRARQQRPIEEFDPFAGRIVSRWVLRAAILLLPVLFGVQLHLLHFQALHENGGPRAGIYATLAIPVYTGLTYEPVVHIGFSAIAGLAVLLGTLCLVRIAAGLGTHRDPATMIMLFAAVLAFALEGVFAPAMSTTDPFDYLQALAAGWKTYRLDTDLPTAGWIYGPVWFSLATVITSFGNSVTEKIEALRVFNALLVGGALAAMRFARFPAGALGVFALNPAIWFEGVANPHLEIWGLALVTAAYAFAVRSKQGGWLAAFALALAGAVKLPYLVLGGAAMASVAPLRRRCLIVAGSALLAVAGSWIFGGSSYFASVAGFAVHRAGTVGGWNQAVRLGELCIAIAFSAWGFARGRNFAGMAWLAPQFAPLPFPWYSNWGVAFSLDRARWLATFLLSLPLVDLFMDYDYDFHSYGWFPVSICALAVFWDLGLRRRPT